ncbi:hypothetical protein [Sphingomonas azotifigens]|nr:hypothetical protein [Sphingomonas azotifigens]
MRVNYARNTGRPWAVRILLDSPQPRASRRAQTMPFDDPLPRPAAPGRA